MAIAASGGTSRDNAGRLVELLRLVANPLWVRLLETDLSMTYAREPAQ